MRVLSIGAGFPQLDFIKALKDKGYDIVAIGKGRNSKEVIDLCEDFIPIDTHKPEEAIKWIKKYDKHIDAVGSFAGGNAIPTLQAISKYLKLPTMIPDYLMVGMDKFSQQSMYEEHELTTIKSWKAKDILLNNDLISSVEEFIVKPVIGRGSSGVMVLNKSELLDSINSNVYDDETIIQELRRGVEYRTMMMIQDGELKILAPIVRESFDSTFLLGRLSYSVKDYDRIEKYFVDFIKKCDLDNVILKADVLVNEKYIDMIEMDIGVGGGVYYKKYISELFNYDLTGEYINLITGQFVKRAKLPEKNVIMDYVYNLKKIPFQYDLSNVNLMLQNFLGDHKIIQNLLKPEISGNMESNSDFIFTVVHANTDISNLELNKFLNNNVFDYDK